MSIAPIQPDTKLPKLPKVMQYVASISQTETNPPTTDRVLLNTIGPLGGGLIWTRLSAGQYKGQFSSTLQAVMRPDNTEVEIIGNTGGTTITGVYDGTASIQINTQSNGSYSDNCLYQTTLSIYIYRYD